MSTIAISIICLAVVFIAMIISDVFEKVYSEKNDNNAKLEELIQRLEHLETKLKEKQSL